jgi:putative glutamine amidotransferase
MRNDLRSICEVDEERDAMEFALIKRAREMDIPILGICRGMQILNVAFGGSLIADIPSQYKTTITHTYDRENKLDSKHDVKLVSDSYMREDIGALAGRVNSAHHQCMNELAPSFRPAAHSPDGIIEALEWKESLRASKPFLFAVQWHPERLSYDNPMSLTIAKRFLSEVLVSKKTKK